MLGQYFTTENLCISFITSSIKCKYKINCHVNIIDERITLHVLFTYYYINSSLGRQDTVVQLSVASGGVIMAEEVDHT